MIMGAPDLFEATENRVKLKSLYKRREALLKRLQGLPRMSHKRVELNLKLREATTEIIDREGRCYPGGWS